MTELPDRLLREALDDQVSAPPSTMCLDAERLAAWADGALTEAERATVEAHAAGCGRCLALLAAMTRTAPPRSDRPWWRAPAVWLPLATVTAALVIVVRLAVTEQRPPATAALRTADATANRPSPALVAAPPPAVSTSQAAGAPAQQSASAVRSRSAASRRRERSGTDTPPSPAPAAPRPVQPALGHATAPPAPAASAVVSPPAPPPPAAPAVASPPTPPAEAAARQAVSSAPAPPAPATTIAAERPAPAAVPALREEVRTTAAENAFAAKTMMKAAVPAPIVIASPDRSSQWRIVGGRVEHSADSGATWQPQFIGVVTPMRAGAAPDARVCWLTGAVGVVLRTTDAGTTWTRVPFPEAVDLAAIQASDASHAAVTTADGRRFATSDGATWIRP